MFNLCWFGGCHRRQSQEFWVQGLPRGSRTSITLAEEKATLHRPLTPNTGSYRLLSPRALEEGVIRSWGDGTHIVSLVKVDGAGDRRETLIPVMTVPVHS